MSNLPKLQIGKSGTSLMDVTRNEKLLVFVCDYVIVNVKIKYKYQRFAVATNQEIEINHFFQN